MPLKSTKYIYAFVKEKRRLTPEKRRDILIIRNTILLLLIKHRIATIQIIDIIIPEIPLRLFNI